MWVVVVVIMNCGFFFFTLSLIFTVFIAPRKRNVNLFDLKYALQINGECKFLRSSSIPPQKKETKKKVVLEL